jgi:hypothetical protein
MPMVSWTGIERAMLREMWTGMLREMWTETGTPRGMLKVRLMESQTG